MVRVRQVPMTETDSSGSSDDESSGSSESDSGEADNKGTQQGGSDNEGEGSDSEAEESDAGGSSCPSESDHTGSPPKASSPAKKAQKVNLNTSQTLSLPDLDSKDCEEAWRAKQHQDAHLLDTNYGKWWDQKISEGHLQWDEHDKKTYDHADPCKEAKCPNLLGPPLDYMTSPESSNQRRQASMTCATSGRSLNVGNLSVTLN